MTARARHLGALLATLALAACGGKSTSEVPRPSLTPPTQACSAQGQAASDASTLSTVCVLTSQGEFVLELDAAAAPITAANFLTYVTEGTYNRTLIHRVEAAPLHIFQGGALIPDTDYFIYNVDPRRIHLPIALESNNGLSNLRGTIGMARGSAPDSATVQYFLNVQDNKVLDYRPPGDPAGSFDGYAVFGRVISGIATLDAIGTLPTVFGAAGFPEMPSPMVVVYWAKQLKCPGAAPAPPPCGP